MHVFTCNNCQNPVYFDNFLCTLCGERLAFIPDHQVLSVLKPQRGAPDRYTALAPAARQGVYRLCQNSLQHGACNWAISDHDENELCRACRLNGTIPCLAEQAHREAWLRLEASKRRLLYSLLTLGLPIESRSENPEAGLEFSFLASSAGQQVFTGHSDGQITINVAEADDPFREKMRKQLGENYRTLLGHFRHEIGHFYWNRLIAKSERLSTFRALFGDEQASYQDAVQRHYVQGAPADWNVRFVSAYATMHPWEDWAETWAHYMHMVDVLETAGRSGSGLRCAPRVALVCPRCTPPAWSRRTSKTSCRPSSRSRLP
jgi:hypothetical protein